MVFLFKNFTFFLLFYFNLTKTMKGNCYYTSKKRKNQEIFFSIINYVFVNTAIILRNKMVKMVSANYIFIV